MTKEQREALTALRDVMEKYDIEFGHHTTHRYFNIFVNGKIFDFYQGVNKVRTTDITDLLEQDNDKNK